MITPDWHPGARQLRQFAAGVLVVSALLAVGLAHRTGSVRAAALPAVLGTAVFLVGLIFPVAVRPLYRVLALVGFPVGWVVSEVILRVVFYLVLTPLGVIFRITGRDPLQLKRHTGSTYWREAKRDRPPSSYFRQS